MSTKSGMIIYIYRILIQLHVIYVITYTLFYLLIKNMLIAKLYRNKIIYISIFMYFMLIEYINLIFSNRNVIFIIFRMMGKSTVSKIVGNNAASLEIDMNAWSANGFDHITSIGTIAIWTVRS